MAAARCSAPLGQPVLLVAAAALYCLALAPLSKAAEPSISGTMTETDCHTTNPIQKYEISSVLKSNFMLLLLLRGEDDGPKHKGENLQATPRNPLPITASSAMSSQPGSRK